jgi:hypothetical protein
MGADILSTREVMKNRPLAAGDTLDTWRTTSSLADREGEHPERDQVPAKRGAEAPFDALRRDRRAAQMSAPARNQQARERNGE